jgi:DNA polymerase III gamma/tau subunit
MDDWALKHRSKQFKDIVGNEKTIKDLKSRSKDRTFSKVTMFIGTTGTGKTSLSLIEAKAMLCENLQEDGEPCCECRFCKIVENRTPNEIIKFYHGSNLSIDSMRDLEDFTNRKILGSKNSTKIIFIEELQEIAQVRTLNNVLLLMEKEHDNTYFIVSAMNKIKLSDAVLGRSTIYNISLDYKNIRENLVNIIKKENIIPTKELAQMVVTIANNFDMRAAIHALERVIRSEITTEEELYKELGIMSEESVNNFINGLLKADIQIIKTKPDQNLLEQIKTKLVLLFEYYNGLDLNQWQKGQLNGIEKTSANKIEIVLLILQELMLFPYLSPSIIEFQLVKCIMKLKELNEVTEQIKPVRGR